MPAVYPLFLIVPLLLAALLCWVARAVARGSAAAQEFEIANRAILHRWEAGLDFMMLAGAATFIIFIDEHDIHSIQIFVYGLVCLSVSSVALAGLGRALRVAWPSVVVRKIAFRAMVCLTLFTLVLGMRASGIGHKAVAEDGGRPVHYRG